MFLLAIGIVEVLTAERRVRLGTQKSEATVTLTVPLNAAHANRLAPSLVGDGLERLISRGTWIAWRIGWGRAASRP
jgi:hypothetical protein